MWQPAHERHAIERVSVSFQFDSELPSRLWQSLINKATVEIPKKGFNATNDEVGFNVSFGPGGVVAGGAAPPGVQISPAGIQIGGGPGVQFGQGGVFFGGGQPMSSPPSGRTFRVVINNEVQEEVSLHRNRLVYATTLYDRWNVFKARATSLVGSFLDQALPVAHVSTVKLEYWDRFVYDGPKAEADFRQLLKSDSQYIARFSSDMKELWHSHIGLFAHPGSSSRRLLNLNVDAIDLSELAAMVPDTAPQERRSVGLYSMAQDTIAAEESPSNMAEATSTLDEMHTILKEILTDVITDEVAKQISLNAQEPQ